MGEAQSVMQALPVGAWNVSNDKAGLGSGVNNCRLTLYLDGENFSFGSSDFVFAGYANFIPLEFRGLSQQEAVDILVSGWERAYVGPAGTPIEELVEQELQYTAVKSAIHPVLGRVIYRDIGFIAHFEPGDYVIYWEEDWIWGPAEATVNLTILP
jgi:hypothetical protein